MDTIKLANTVQEVDPKWSALVAQCHGNVIPQDNVGVKDGFGRDR